MKQMGINIGRSKIVETKDAVVDFVSAFDKLYSYGDFFTLNVSSPNTPELRDLQERDRLQGLLRAIQEKNYQLSSRFGQTPKPILVKIAPDMDFSQADDIVGVVMSEKISGIIATNATAFLRETLVSGSQEPGGLSGKPLRALATSFVRHLYRAVGGRLPIIGMRASFWNRSGRFFLFGRKTPPRRRAAHGHRFFYWQRSGREISWGSERQCLQR
jgi:dihydroorotate dehydrogenase